jgi:predicted RNA binding protein YcfA (HicA-like mRNA interferase family)
MRGAEFVRLAKRYAKRTGKECRFVPGHGKGSHGRLYIGGRFTTVKRGEIPPGLLRAMLKQLGIDKEEF